MTVENSNIIYKIVVSGIESYTQELPSTITTNFVLDEVVTGVTSGATAVVDQATALIDTAIRIRTKSGFFIENEDLTGSVAGIATKISSTEVVNAPYENASFDITGGEWTLLSDGDLLTKMSDPVEKINISKGGNLASGYSFGFQVTNFEFAKALQTDGVFFRNRKCVLYKGAVDGGIVYTDQWTGAIDSFTDVDENTVSFKCGDLTKQNVTNVGSEKVPITFNNNYNCKLPVQSEDFLYVKQFADREWSAISRFRGVSEIGVYKLDTETLDLINSGDFVNIICDIVAGDGVGNSYQVVDYEVDTSIIWLTLDSNDLTDLKKFNSNDNASSFQSLKRFSYLLNASQNEVQKFHSEESTIQKPANVTTENGVFTIDKENYEIVDNKQIRLKNVTSSQEIIADRSTDIFSNEKSDFSQVFTATQFDLAYPSAQANEIIEINNSSSDIYYVFDSIIVPNMLKRDVPDPLLSPTDYTTDQILSVVGFFMDGINSYDAGTNIKYQLESGDRGSPTSFWYSAGSNIVGVNAKYIEGTIADHWTLVIEPTLWKVYKDNVSLHNLPEIEGVLSHIKSTITVGLAVGFPSVSDELDLTYYGDSDNWDISFTFKAIENLKYSDISIGCNGENVSSAQGIIDGYENVPDTIQYLLEEYYDKELTDINLPSFTEAQDNFALFINDPKRNAAHQIVGQTDGNVLLKDILFDHHLGMFIDHSGQYHLENWLPKSIVFGFKTADTAYDETNVIDIKPIKRDTLNNVVSDYQYKIDLSEATGEHNRTLRVKNPNEATFNFDRDIEGVDESDTALAFSAWQLAKAGYNRVTNLTQTEKSSNWHKLAFSDGTGTSESIAFIRNQLAHVNREHEYITFTVPYNDTNLAKELLSFISIEDAKITDGEARNGWIVERRLNLKNDTITWKMLLDISKYDPFLFQVNVWKDGNFALNIKTDGAFPNNIKSNGTGI